MHEQSETIQLPNGLWINVYGQGTPQSGQPLPLKHTFERMGYDTVGEAVDAARLRSDLTRPHEGQSPMSMPYRNPDDQLRSERAMEVFAQRMPMWDDLRREDLETLPGRVPISRLPQHVQDFLRDMPREGRGPQAPLGTPLQRQPPLNLGGPGPTASDPHIENMMPTPVTLSEGDDFRGSGAENISNLAALMTGRGAGGTTPGMPSPVARPRPAAPVARPAPRPAPAQPTPGPSMMVGGNGGDSRPIVTGQAQVGSDYPTPRPTPRPEAPIVIPPKGAMYPDETQLNPYSDWRGNLRARMGIGGAQPSPPSQMASTPGPSLPSISPERKSSLRAQLGVDQTPGQDGLMAALTALITRLGPRTAQGASPMAAPGAPLNPNTDWRSNLRQRMPWIGQ